ncbi:hypothetical protein JHK86_000872 [Glycine max]|nr:hypothetical protein JHK86_000872 [Glycine max]
MKLVVFYHFGHGLQQSEYYKGDEIDRLDEPICPDDFMRERMISENNINSTIVQPLKKGIWKWKDNKPTHSKKKTLTKQTSGGRALNDLTTHSLCMNSIWWKGLK